VSTPSAPPTSPTPPALPQSKQESLAPPWVTDEEIAKAHAAGRILLPESPEQLVLLNLSHQDDHLPPYVGKWIKISHKVIDVNDMKLTNNKTYLIVNLYSQCTIRLLFEPKGWEERLLTLRNGQLINTYCQLYGVNRIELVAMNCDAF
jgi:hypothetical protein